MSFHPKPSFYHEGRTKKGLQYLAEGALLSRVIKSHLVGGEEPASWCACIRRSLPAAVLHVPEAGQHLVLQRTKKRVLPPWLNVPDVGPFPQGSPSSNHSSPVFFPGGQRRQQDVYSLHMDLVFIYLSIIMFIFVHTLTVSSLLPPTVLLQLLPGISPASGLWALPLLQEMLGWRARKDMLLGNELGPRQPS